MLAFAGTYPSFFEQFATSGPLIQGVSLLLVTSFLWGAFLLLRHRYSPPVLMLVVWAPSFFGCVLAVFQSFVAESIASNETGIISWSRPDRYIGHIRLYLAIGTAMSLVLFCVHLLSLRRNR